MDGPSAALKDGSKLVEVGMVGLNNPKGSRPPGHQSCSKRRHARVLQNTGNLQQAHQALPQLGMPGYQFGTV